MENNISKLKVLHFCNSFSHLSETFIYDYIIELERQGIDNYVVTFNRLNEQDRPFNKVTVVKPKKDFYWVILRLLSLFNKTPGKYWKIQRRNLIKPITMIKPDIIHAQFGPNGVLVSEITKKFNIPLVVTFHGYDISSFLKHSFWIAKYKELFKDTKLILGVSKHIVDKLKEIGADEEVTKVFAAGINLDNFKYRETKFEKDKIIRLIHIGRLVEKKSPILLVKAFNIVYQHLNYKVNIKLTIIGDGPLKNETQDLIDKLKLNDHVEILGAVKHNDINNFLVSSSIYVQHCITAKDGDQEGLGVTFLEASATGLPIVTTLHNGIPDAVKQNLTGYLVPEGDYELMAIKIIELIENEDIAKRFGNAGRIFVESNFNIKKQSMIAINMYKNVLMQ